MHIINTHDRQRRTEKKKAQYFITQEVPPKCNYMYPQYWNIPLGFLAGETSVQQPVPRSTWRYQDICVHIYIDGVCVHWMPDSMHVATSDAYRAPRRHVWRVGFPSAPLTVCGVARSGLLQCCPICDCSSGQTDGSNVVNSPV